MSPILIHKLKAMREFFSQFARSRWCVKAYDDGNGGHCAVGFMRVHGSLPMSSTELARAIEPAAMKLDPTLKPSDDCNSVLIRTNDGVGNLASLGDHPKDRVLRVIDEQLKMASEEPANV
jgi:hypothetical protein